MTSMLRPLPPTMVHHEAPSYIYQMKRQLVDSVIDQQFAKYHSEVNGETVESKSTPEIVNSAGSKFVTAENSSSSSVDTNEEFETIIDVEGERECSYIKKVLDEPIREERKKPSWSVADMLREEPPKRQKARRKPQTPLCYRARQEEFLRPYEDFQRVPYMPFGVQNFMRDREAFEQQIRQFPNFQQQQQDFFGGKRANIGSHQFSILGHRKMKMKAPRGIPNSPLDVQNLVAKQSEGPKRPCENDNEVVILDRSPSPVSTPSPKSQYVPKFFQNLPKENVDKIMDKKTTDFVSAMMRSSKDKNTEHVVPTNSENSKEVIDVDENTPIALVKERNEIPESSRTSEKLSESASEEKSDHSESSNFASVLTSFIACMLDRGALDLSKATTSSSKLIQDKLNNIKSEQCACQPRRPVNPSRSSAKAGVLEPLPTTCSPSPPPAPEAHHKQDTQKHHSHGNNQFFLERTRELQNFHHHHQFHQPQLPPFHQQFMQSYDNLFKMAAIPGFSMMPQPGFQMNGPFIVPSCPPPKRARMVPSIF